MDTYRAPRRVHRTGSGRRTGGQAHVLAVRWAHRTDPRPEGETAEGRTGCFWRGGRLAAHRRRERLRPAAAPRPSFGTRIVGGGRTDRMGRVGRLGCPGHQGGSLT